ncbi:MAG: sulfatase [Anaerolineae bacterium]|nr:sulfatase [Anaerolineae bacterium]
MKSTTVLSTNGNLKSSITLFLLILTTACSLNPPQTASQNPDQPPNIIYILTDDQPAASIEHMPTVKNSLAAEGFTFSNGYVTTPQCCPSRASILTGKYAHNHGVLSNSKPIGGASVFNDTTTLATLLHEAGYQTALFGKYLNGYRALGRGYIPPGWDQWFAFVKSSPKTTGAGYYWGYTMSENGNRVQYGFEEEDYSTVVIEQKVIKFIKNAGNKPFFLYISLAAPHPRQLFLNKDSEYFNESMVSFTPNFNEEDLSDKPAWLQKLRKIDPEDATRTSLRVLKSLKPVDDAVKRIQSTLENYGLAENTVIIFHSDNGLSLGEHRRLNQKSCPYEECIKVPLVLYDPDHKTEGITIDSFALNIDIAPTILQIAGITPNQDMDGQSLLYLMEKDKQNWRDAFIFEHFQRKHQIPPYIGIRTERWKYVIYQSTGEIELYDMENDPWEMENLANTGGYEDIIAELQTKMDALLEK